ncbi:winged helix-turn-helix transcriptional regulator [Streptodolium elevatio]
MPNRAEPPPKQPSPTPEPMPAATEPASPARAPLTGDFFDPACPQSAVPIRIGEKWAGMVVVCLADGPRRFSELKVPLRGITPKVLTETLRALERDGMVTRTAYNESPPRVEYALTDLGRTLLGPIQACREWAAANLPALLAAREAYLNDREHAAG